MRTRIRGTVREARVAQNATNPNSFIIDGEDDNLTYYCEFENVIKKIESHQLKEKLAKSCVLIRILNYFR